MNNTFTDDKVNTSLCPEDTCIIPSIDPVNNTCVSPKGIIYDCSIDSKGNITGFTEDHKKALYSVSDNKWLYGKEIGYSNLIDLANNSERARILGEKGRQKAKENREAKKNFNELAKALLEQVASDKVINETLEDPGMMIDNTYGSLILAAMLQGAKNGSFKCAEFIRDTAGYKPKNEVELQADIMTEADKSLIDKALKTG